METDTDMKRYRQTDHCKYLEIISYSKPFPTGAVMNQGTCCLIKINLSSRKFTKSLDHRRHVKSQDRKRQVALDNSLKGIPIPDSDPTRDISKYCN